MVNNQTKNVLILAGEASGDLHGANLVHAMKKLSPKMELQGIGGERMEEAGVQILVHSSDMAVVGLTEIFSKLIVVMRARRKLKNIIKSSRPDLLVLIDYPDFNINLAGFAKRYGIPVLYYISPQVWAWRQGRISKIAKRVDRMAVILPFEKEFYLQKGADMVIEYVGHPLLDGVPDIPDKKKTRQDLGLSDDSFVLGLLPGSRDEELKNLLPSMIGAAEILSKHYKKMQCLLPIASTISHELVDSIIDKSSIDVIVSSKDIYTLLSVCDFVFVTSGTATLETAIMEVPMVIVYRMSRISFWIGKMVIKVPYVGLVNLIAGREVVPELIQDKVTPDDLAEKAISILKSKKIRSEIAGGLRMVRERLGTGGASARTAEIALAMLRN